MSPFDLMAAVETNWPQPSYNGHRLRGMQPVHLVALADQPIVALKPAAVEVVR